MNGKGDARRPKAISDTQFATNWNRTFMNTECPRCGVEQEMTCGVPCVYCHYRPSCEEG
jgi:hypothetical protein